MAGFYCLSQEEKSDGVTWAETGEDGGRTARVGVGVGGYVATFIKKTTWLCLFLNCTDSRTIRIRTLMVLSMSFYKRPK